MIASQKNEYIQKLRLAVSGIMRNLNELERLKAIWDSQGGASAFEAGDFVDSNAGLTVNDLADAFNRLPDLQAACITGNGGGNGTILNRLVYI